MKWLFEVNQSSDRCIYLQTLLTSIHCFWRIDMILQDPSTLQSEFVARHSYFENLGVQLKINQGHWVNCDICHFLLMCLQAGWNPYNITNGGIYGSLMGPWWYTSGVCALSSFQDIPGMCSDLRSLHLDLQSLHFYPQLLHFNSWSLHFNHQSLNINPRSLHLDHQSLRFDHWFLHLDPHFDPHFLNLNLWSNFGVTWSFFA